MLVGIHQLHYIPWLRYFDKIVRSDVFIVLDNIQYNKNGWQNRNKIKTAQGVALLTVPVFEKMGQTLEQVHIDNGVPWARKHLRTLEQAYAKAPHFSAHRPFLIDTYARSWDCLNDLNRHMLGYWISTLGIATRVVYASELDAPGVGTERLIHLIRAVGGDQYYSGAYATEAYLDATRMEDAGIGLELQEWRAPDYPQLHGAFIPDLSILDLVMNCGPDSLSTLLGTRT